MKAKTHVITAALSGYLVYPHWQGIVVGGIGGLVPDLSSPYSYLGRKLRGISDFIYHTVGHRSLTHSALLVVTFYFFIRCFSVPCALAFCAGIIAHILGDMLTGKVRVLWPFGMSFGIHVPQAAVPTIDMIARLSAIGYSIVLGWHWIATNSQILAILHMKTG